MTCDALDLQGKEKICSDVLLLCVLQTKDWWTYEFCHGQYIRQYHLEGKNWHCFPRSLFKDKYLVVEYLVQVVLLSLDTEIKGEILFLGYYESEFDWSNETAKVRLLQVFLFFSFFK